MNNFPVSFRIALLSIFLCAKSYSQFYQLKNYNVKDGLPSSEVYAMKQDASGYLWFATDMGVSRFDGYSFKNFTTEDGLADNTNFGIVQDGKGRIWFRSFSGKLSYYENGKIKTLPCNTALEKLLIRKSITSLYIDKYDTIRAGVNTNSYLRIAPPWNTDQAVLVNVPSENEYIIRFTPTDFIHGGKSPLKTDLDVLDKDLHLLYSIPLGVDCMSGGHTRFTCQLLPDQTFLCTGNDVIAHFSPAGLISRRQYHSILIDVLPEGNNNLLVATYDGLRNFSLSNFQDEIPVSQLDKKVITSVCRDHENSLWFCTEGNGVYCIRHKNFRYYSTDDGLPESKITCVTKTGIGVACGHLNSTITLLDHQQVQSISLYRDTTSLSSSSRINTIAYDGKNKIYIGTIGKVLSYDLASKKTNTCHNTGSKMIIPSSDNKFWSLEFHAIFKYDFDHLSSVKDTVKLSSYCDNIYEDKKHAVWICSSLGILRWDSVTGLTDYYRSSPFLQARVVDLQEDHDGNLWMVSRGNGVIIKKENGFINITKKDGLAANMCRAVFVDSNNVVWVGTNNGLSRIESDPGNATGYTVSTFTSKNGLLTNEVNDIISVGSKLWLIHNNGITILDPSGLQTNTSPPPVYITGLRVNDDTLTPEKEIRVGYDQNYFTISFTGISFKDPGNIQYRYKMEGVDETWKYTSYTSINYQTLPPGHYRFIVFAQNNDGYWSLRPATFSFTILPAWWQTWIFLVSLIVVVLVLILLGFKLRLDVIRRREQKKSALQNRIAAIELNALRAQMNPHFVFNSINSVQYFITNNDPDSSQKYLSKFARLIRYVVDNSKLTSIPVRKEIEALTLYLELEALRFGKRFTFEIHVSPEVDTEYTQIPSMLIQPYVENSIWHGIMHKDGNGKIEIFLEMKKKTLVCIIQDNGIGRKRSMEIRKQKESTHQSVGMSNTKERLDIINQVNNSEMSVEVSDIVDEKGNICGTNVEIHIPVS